MVTNYESIQNNQDTQALRSVVDYLYDIQLTQDFIDSVTPTLFGGESKRVVPIDMVGVSAAAQKKMETVWSSILFPFSFALLLKLQPCLLERLVYSHLQKGSGLLNR